MKRDECRLTWREVKVLSPQQARSRSFDDVELVWGPTRFETYQSVESDAVFSSTGRRIRLTNWASQAWQS